MSPEQQILACQVLVEAMELYFKVEDANWKTFLGKVIFRMHALIE